MKFLYSKMAKNTDIQIQGEGFLHLKARRAKIGDRIDVRNLQDGVNYIYEITQFDKKSVNLTLVFSHSVENKTSNLTLAWAIIEPKIIEKTLPSLNELGVSKIIFFYGDFSQKNFKIDCERLERILINSCQQCGRNDIMKFQILKNIDELAKNYQNLALIDFEAQSLDMYDSEILIIGAEGGFSQSERQKVTKKYSLKTKNILRSQTAILSVTAKILL
ncbi:MAG: 16S rRNA (uracil(1498)-N(3))-methyltransferase [Campylobacter sp.]